MNSEGAEASVQVNGPALRFVRESRRRSVASVAKAAGVSTSFLAAVERGARPGMRVEVFGRVVEALQVRDDRVLRADPYSERVKIRACRGTTRRGCPSQRPQSGATLIEFNTQDQNEHDRVA